MTDQEILAAVQPYINALGDTVTALPGEVCVIGFVFEPNMGFNLHFGNIQFFDPDGMVFLHGFLSRAMAEAMKRGDMQPTGQNSALLRMPGMPQVNIGNEIQTPEKPEQPILTRPGFVGAVPIPPQDLKEKLMKDRAEPVMFTLADVLAKMVLMCPADAIPPEIVDAAKQYSNTRTNK